MRAAARRRPYGMGLICVLLLCPLMSAFGESGVSVWEETIRIPTYLTGEPERNPIFYTGRAYQGAKGPVYPYPLIDKLTDTRLDVAYKAVFLENAFIRLCVLPELGGRIFEAVDKTNGYDFFYRQHVIKPALIGMTGAWISGGVEWSTPHHHRATSFMPVEYTLQENPDGSKTIWVGEIELRHRMRWAVGLTLYPGKSIVEATVRLYNRTPYIHSFLYWANVAVHTNPDYQVIFPPSTQFATYHSKNQFSRWPISTEVYHGADYTRGVDVSWWKNHPSPTSMFAWDCREDFLAGYDHGRSAGVVHVADHHVVPGKKFWTWGTGEAGQRWERILTDDDGPYLELMVGAFSDNQPDYSWIQPYEVKAFRQIWYPLRGLGGVKHANEKAAVNVAALGSDLIMAGINTTEEYDGARARLETGNRVLFDRRITIGPDRPFVEKVSISPGLEETALCLTLLDPDGDTLITYKPRSFEEKAMPEPVHPPEPPERIAAVERLVLTGRRLEQFYSPAEEPDPYYEEALRRSPEDTRANTALGLLYCRRGRFEEAAVLLQRSVDRQNAEYTRPRSGESTYYLGVAQRALGHRAEAIDAFQRAAWDHAFNSAACTQLAELACRGGDLSLALAFADRALSSNALNPRARVLRIALLRRLGRDEAAIRSAKEILSVDPLDPWALHEMSLLVKEGNPELPKGAEPMMKWPGGIQTRIELAVDYGNIGDYDAAADILSACIPDKGGTHPMVYYFLGHYLQHSGKSTDAESAFRNGREANPDYCFPFRHEALDALQAAACLDTADAMAYAYSGNLLYDHRPEQAVKAWKRSAALDSGLAQVHRNLGFAFGRDEDKVNEAIARYERALDLSPEDPRLIYELDLMYEHAGAEPGKRLAVMESRLETVYQHDNALSRFILLLAITGRYGEAIDILSTHHFHSWEGGGQIRNVYADVYLLRGLERFYEGRYGPALSDVQAALDYPENLEVGRPLHDRRTIHASVIQGRVYRALGDEKRADTAFREAARPAFDPGNNDARFYQACALRQIGEAGEARALFERLIRENRLRLDAGTRMDFFAKFGERQAHKKRMAEVYYLIGLGYSGLGRQRLAVSAFDSALEFNRGHLWAAWHMKRLER